MADALHVIQDLQSKLRRITQELQRQHSQTAQAEASERQAAERHEKAKSLHEETFKHLQSAFQERDLSCSCDLLASGQVCRLVWGCDS